MLELSKIRPFLVLPPSRTALNLYHKSVENSISIYIEVFFSE